MQAYAPPLLEIFTRKSALIIKKKRLLMRLFFDIRLYFTS